MTLEDGWRRPRVVCRPTNALVVSYPATSRQTDQSGMSQRCDEQRETRHKLEFLPRALSRPFSLPRWTKTTPASTASASRAWGSQLEHLHGRSRLPARGRCRPSDVTSRVGAVRATSRRGASGGITGGGWCPRSLCPRRRGGQSAFPLLTACFYSKLREKKK